MYPRSKLLRKLLADDGVVFISIGEIEYLNLRLVCDQIFGTKNYITEFGRPMKRRGTKGQYNTPSLDYVLTYAKSIGFLPYLRAVMTQKQKDALFKFVQQEDPRKGERYGEERLFKSA